MIEKTVILKNRLGLHARAASHFVKLAKKFNSSISIIKDGVEINGKSILGILTLAANRGAELILKIDGNDEKEAMNSLENLIENKFGEEE
ncbi:MAG: HPr family phosphocarrier protein [Acidobacteriota bacterium]